MQALEHNGITAKTAGHFFFLDMSSLWSVLPSVDICHPAP